MRVSLIVPARNSARTLAACLESCRTQTHSDVEVIVVDNSSTDGTVEIAQALADLTFDQKLERSAQRNRGAAESTGDIVVFIDSTWSSSRQWSRTSWPSSNAGPRWAL